MFNIGDFVYVNGMEEEDCLSREDYMVFKFTTGQIDQINVHLEHKTRYRVTYQKIGMCLWVDEDALTK